MQLKDKLNPDNYELVSSNVKAYSIYREFLLAKLKEFKAREHKLVSLKQATEVETDILNLINDELKSDNVWETQEEIKTEISYQEIADLYLKLNDQPLSNLNNDNEFNESSSLDLGLHSRRYRNILSVLKHYALPPLRAIVFTRIPPDYAEFQEFVDNSIQHNLHTACISTVNNETVNINQYLSILEKTNHSVFLGWFKVSFIDFEYILKKCFNKIKLVFERWNITIEDGLDLRSEDDCTLQELVIYDTKLKQDELQILVESITNSPLNESLTELKFYRLGLQKQDVMNICSSLKCSITFL